MASCNVMICHPATLSGGAERPKVAGAVIEAYGRLLEEIKAVGMDRAYKHLRQASIISKDFKAKAVDSILQFRRCLFRKGKRDNVARTDSLRLLRLKNLHDPP